MGKKPVDSFVPAQVVALSDAGLKQVQAPKQLEISRDCVQNAIKKYKETSNYSDGKRIGHPKKIPDGAVRQLKRLVKEDARIGAAKITSDLNASLPKPVHQGLYVDISKILALNMWLRLKNNG